VYASWLEKKIELYELLIGRKAKGILLIITGENMDIPFTKKGMNKYIRDIDLEVYFCGEIDFHP